MKNKRPVIYYDPIDGSAPLSIYWHSGPKGDAVEANNKKGVGFFSPKGELMGVIFDDVSYEKDSQELIFDDYRITLQVKKGSVKHKLSEEIQFLDPDASKAFLASLLSTKGKRKRAVKN